MKRAKDAKVVDSIVHKDAGYRVLNSEHCLPSFWESKKVLMAMIWQLGLLTFFFMRSTAVQKLTGKSKEEYLSLKKSTVFGKGSLNDLAVNTYNTTILSLCGSNMDQQFVLKAFACAHYILSYINKSDRGISKLIHDSLEQS
ncbi:hypothetical protein JTE90_015069 [Oedothorax gibbosus]|uniref:Uncharacterized protein n=1 Tax=Oedothorax gibbosus TaxID=931172 RepID=A0AAV6VTR9_9ARAC|nr:hypothetical protein JTE90_015069 [Oedothorax gibbosus]